MVRPTPPRVILVRPKYAGNVGASARAMGNMGLTDLRIVDPGWEREAVQGESLDAWSMAASGRAILEGAQTVPTVAEAIGDCTTVLACTARPRRWTAWKILGPTEGTKLLAERAAQGDATAILFGPEDHGLSTDDLAQATHICNIPTGGQVSSLNLAQAVLLLGWEWARADGNLQRRPTKRGGLRPRADVVQIDGMVAQVGALLDRIDFFRRKPRRQNLATLRQAMIRGELTNIEVHFLRGVVRKVRWHLEHPGHLVEGAAPMEPDDPPAPDNEPATDSGPQKT